MIVDKSYFTGNINVPNADKPGVSEKLDWYINNYEPKLMTLLLGHSFYTAMSDVCSESEDEEDQRWTDLCDGVVYTGLDGRERKWRGIKEVIIPGANEDAADVMQSFIADYIWYYFTRSIATQTAGIGQIITKAENADVVSPAQKMTSVWNEMVDWIYELYYFLDSKTDTYPEYDTYFKTVALSTQIRKINIFNI